MEWVLHSISPGSIDSIWEHTFVKPTMVFLRMPYKSLKSKFTVRTIQQSSNSIFHNFHLAMFLVPPLIRIHRQMVGGYNGSFTIMDCSIEAFPLAVHYWERHDGRVIQSRKDKYLVSTKDSDIYKTNLFLNIRYCVELIFIITI
jgi:hypothetical protein